MAEATTQHDRPLATGESETIVITCRVVDCTDKSRPADEEKNSAARQWFADLASSLIKAAVLFFLGYLLIQSVELDLKQAQFTADAADKLKQYLVDLNSDGALDDEANSEATALALGGFGGVAAYPLVAMIDRGDEKRLAWGKIGLEQAGRIAPEETCGVLEAAIDDPTQSYRWRTRKTAVEVAGSIGCLSAARPLGRLKDSLEGMNELTALQRKNFETVIDQALSRIERAASRRDEWRLM
jgi:hypothetical protein